MQEGKDKIKDLFKAGLDNYQVSPPPGVWGGIMQHRRKRRLMVWRWAAAASLVLLMGLGVLIYTSINTEQSLYTEIPEETTKPDKGLSSKSLEQESAVEAMPLSHPQFIAELKPIHYVRLKHISGVILVGAIRTDHTYWPLQLTNELPFFYETDMQLALEEAESGAHTDSLQSETAITVSAPLNLSELYAWEKSGTKSGDQNERWNIALGYGTNPSFAMPDADYVIEETRSTFAHDNFSSDIAYETSYYEQIESTDHKYPVGLGLMAGFALTKRWQIESGLVYTRLTTVNRTYKMNGMHKEFETSIYYLGMPVGLRFHFIHRELWKLYLGQSMVIEKGLRNQFTTYYYDQDVEMDAESTYAPVRGVQLSLLSSLGVDITISNHFSLYGQGGVQYFFLNESQPYTIRSTNPLWPSIQTGIRYTFR